MDFLKIILTTKEKINFLNALSLYVDGRLAQINDKIDSSNNLQLHIILQIGIAMSLYIKSLVESLETGNIIAAQVLFRSLIEAFINIEYIMQDDTQKRGVAFVFEDFKTQRINITTIKNLIVEKPSEANLFPELSTIEKCDEQLEKIENDKKNILSILNNDFGIEIEASELIFPPVEQCANKANLKDIYSILYRQLCWVTHLNSSGLKELIKFDNNKYIIVPINIEEETKKIIPIAYDIYILTIEGLLKKFNLYIEEDFKAMEDISTRIKI
ncbi:MAG: DUF5677 domain-containing protein [Candidatus Humimicrobiaceae bacterium]